jgi:ribosome biogenesis GTPase A
LNKADLVTTEKLEEATAFIKETYKLPSVFLSAESELNFEELTTQIRVIYDRLGAEPSSTTHE